MARIFREHTRNIPYLLPPSVQDWLPKDHLAYFVVDVVGQLDLSEITGCYRGGGSQAYAPDLLIGLLFYGYMTGVFSSRKMEAATYESLAFRYIVANQHPDHDTISDFRRKFLPQLEGIFLQILCLARQMGVKQVGKVSLDGTKMKANASKHKALSYGHAQALELQLKAEIEALFKQAEIADNAPKGEGMNVPDEIARRDDRLKAIAAAKATLEARAKERSIQEKAAHEAQMAKRQEKAEKTGKKPAGKVPREPSDQPRATDQVNLTDEESRIMPQSGGGFVQAYNAQAMVDIDTMLIVGTHVSQCCNDKKELVPALAILEKLPESVARITDILADTGYHSAANIDACLQQNIGPVIAEKREKHNRPLAERYQDPPALAPGASAAEKASHRLRTLEGKALYAKRKSTVEPVFGIIKQAMGFRQFMLRGLEKVSGEWNLVAIAYNLKRLQKLAAT
jgi:transposase